MPLYEYKCDGCGLFQDRILKLAEYQSKQVCECGNVLTKLVSKPIIRGDNVDYDCAITGKHIGSRKQHEENLKRQGCRVSENGEKEDVQRQRIQAEQRLEKNVGETVERFIENLPSRKKESLYNEMEHSDIALERG